MDQGIFQNVFNRKVEPIKRSIIEARLGLSPSLVVVDELKMTPIFPQFSVKLIIIQESFEKSVLHTETASAFPSWILSWMDVGHSVQTISRIPALTNESARLSMTDQSEAMEMTRHSALSDTRLTGSPT